MTVSCSEKRKKRWTFRNKNFGESRWPSYEPTFLVQDEVLPRSFRWYKTYPFIEIVSWKYKSMIELVPEWPLKRNPRQDDEKCREGCQESSAILTLLRASFWRVCGQLTDAKKVYITARGLGKFWAMTSLFSAVRWNRNYSRRECILTSTPVQTQTDVLLRGRFTTSELLREVQGIPSKRQKGLADKEETIETRLGPRPSHSYLNFSSYRNSQIFRSRKVSTSSSTSFCMAFSTRNALQVESLHGTGMQYTTLQLLDSYCNKALVKALSTGFACVSSSTPLMSAKQWWCGVTWATLECFSSTDCRLWACGYLSRCWGESTLRRANIQSTQLRG